MQCKRYVGLAQYLQTKYNFKKYINIYHSDTHHWRRRRWHRHSSWRGLKKCKKNNMLLAQTIGGFNLKFTYQTEQYNTFLPLEVEAYLVAREVVEASKLLVEHSN